MQNRVFFDMLLTLSVGVLERLKAAIRAGGVALLNRRACVLSTAILSGDWGFSIAKSIYFEMLKEG